MLNFDEIAERIKYVRELGFQSQRSMASSIPGMHQGDYSKIENNRSSAIHNLITLEKIANELNVDLRYILYGDESYLYPFYSGSEKLSIEQIKDVDTHYKKNKVSRGEKISAMNYCCSNEYYIYLGESENKLKCPTFNKYLSFNKVSCLIDFYNYQTHVNEIEESYALMYEVNMKYLYSIDGMQVISDSLPEKVVFNKIFNILNPYCEIYKNSRCKEKKAKSEQLMNERFTVLSKQKSSKLLFISYVHVAEHLRKHGMFNFLLDSLNAMYPNCVICINLSDTGSDSFDEDYEYAPADVLYDKWPVEFINANIMKNKGYVIDDFRPVTVVQNENGVDIMNEVYIPKSAYMLPYTISKLIKNDEEIVTSL